MKERREKHGGGLLLLRCEIAFFSRCIKGKYFGQKLLFLRPPKMKIYLFLPCFPATKNSQSCKVRPRLARSAENFEYLVLILAKMIINGRKTGKKRPNRAKTGKIPGFHFSCSALFLPCFLETLFLPHPRGGGYWPKYLPLVDEEDDT